MQHTLDSIDGLAFYEWIVPLAERIWNDYLEETFGEETKAKR